MINNRKEKTVLAETRTDRNTFFTVQKYNCYKKNVFTICPCLFSKMWIVMCITADSYVESMWKGCG